MLQPVKHTRGLPLVCNYIFPTGELKTGHSNHSPPPASYAVVSTAQYEAGPLPWKDTSVTWTQLVEVLFFCGATFHLSSSHCMTLFQVQDSSPANAESKFLSAHFSQPAKVALTSTPSSPEPAETCSMFTVIKALTASHRYAHQCFNHNTQLQCKYV